MKTITLAITILLIAIVETGCYTVDPLPPIPTPTTYTSVSKDTSYTSSGGSSSTYATATSRTWVNGYHNGGTWVRGHFE